METGSSLFAAFNWLRVLLLRNIKRAFGTAGR